MDKTKNDKLITITPKVMDLDKDTQYQKIIEHAKQIPINNKKKPIYEKITTVPITDAAVIFNELKKDEKSNKNYVSFYLTINYEDHSGSYSENYGQGRLIIDENNLALNKLWVGTESALGKLLLVIQQHFTWNGTIENLTKILIGQKANMITEQYQIKGTTFTKNVIKGFTNS